MPRDTRPHIAGPPVDGPRHLTKQEFGRRLMNAIIERRWNQSDLARAADLPRDSISTYVRGKSFPTPLSLSKIAAALRVDPEELLPNHTERAIAEDEPALEVKVSPARPGAAWLRVNRLVSLATAVQITRLIEEDHAGRETGDRE